MPQRRFNWNLGAIVWKIGLLIALVLLLMLILLLAFGLRAWLTAGHAAPSLSPPDAFLCQASSMGIEFEPSDVERLGTFLALLPDATEEKGSGPFFSRRATINRIESAHTLRIDVAFRSRSRGRNRGRDLQTTAPVDLPAAARLPPLFALWQRRRKGVRHLFRRRKGV